ncbi:MAG TPA: MarR family transcriptional regulator [Gemmatimonadaceae bacterium]
MNQADGATTTPNAGSVAFSIMHAAHLIEEKIESALDNVGLSMAKHSALSKLYEAGEPLTLSDLAAKLSCVRSNITQLVDRLESDGLVRRVADPSDRRSIRAELTELGIEKHAAGAAEVGRIQSEVAEKLATTDLSALESALASIA